MKELSVKIISDYIEDCLFEPRSNWPVEIFEERAVERWAAFEILKRVKNSFRRPDIVIEEFLLEVHGYYNISENPKNEKSFSIACEVAEEIGRLFV